MSNNIFPLSSYKVFSFDVLYASKEPSSVVVASLVLSPIGNEDIFEGSREVVIKWIKRNTREETANRELALGADRLDGIMRCFSIISGSFSLKEIIPFVDKNDFYETFKERANEKAIEKHQSRIQLINNDFRLVGAEDYSVFLFEKTDGSLLDTGFAQTCKIEETVYSINRTLQIMQDRGWRSRDLRSRNIHLRNGEFLIGDLGKAKRVSSKSCFSDEKSSLQRELLSIKNRSEKGSGRCRRRL